MKMIFLPTADLRGKSYRISLILFYVGRKLLFGFLQVPGPNRNRLNKQQLFNNQLYHIQNGLELFWYMR